MSDDVKHIPDAPGQVLYAVYDTATGRILRHGQCHTDDLGLQSDHQKGRNVTLHNIHDMSVLTHKIDVKTGEVVTTAMDIKIVRDRAKHRVIGSHSRRMYDPIEVADGSFTTNSSDIEMVLLTLASTLPGSPIKVPMQLEGGGYAGLSRDDLQYFAAQIQARRVQEAVRRATVEKDLEAATSEDQINHILADYEGRG